MLCLIVDPDYERKIVNPDIFTNCGSETFVRNVVQHADFSVLVIVIFDWIDTITLF